MPPHDHRSQRSAPQKPGLDPTARNPSRLGIRSQFGRFVRIPGDSQLLSQECREVVVLIALALLQGP
ncbi:hypothetical protein LshimejAT787_1103510 [Lyophyllum shimeji]|uniref:Uncharacterized protein n=1 Tax=Lyophyllum shimeji TaxID=47721 RepID=A0A9P3PVB5_LYOSH|nr:hypothetical protein LshimejAT787_1103510 [Lyophyllum shimeji]